jgi:hypothetical protein
LTTLKPKMFECFFDRFTYWEQEAQWLKVTYIKTR